MHAREASQSGAAISFRAALHTGHGCRAGRKRSGYFLIECLMYIAVLALILGIALSAFYRCLDNSRDLARSSDDILRVLRVGEGWRADIRQATTTPKIVSADPLTAFEIPTAKGLIVYAFGDGAVWRKQGDAEPHQLLPRVKACAMLEDHRQRVASWRWELELTTKKKQVRVRPLFTFEAVPSSQ
jgi:hypothetical protein